MLPFCCFRNQRVLRSQDWLNIAEDVEDDHDDDDVLHGVFVCVSLAYQSLLLQQAVGFLLLFAILVI